MPELLYIPKQNLIENNSHRLKFFLYDPNLVTETDGVKDYSAAGIGVSSITSATIKIYNESDDTVILAVTSILSSFDSSGNFSYLIAAPNNAILSTARVQYEDHVAVITIVCATGTETHNIVRNIRLRILNQQYTS